VLLKRRRALFIEDAKNNGYSSLLQKKKPIGRTLILILENLEVNFNWKNIKRGNTVNLKERKFSDWITKGEYPHSQRVLQGYKAVEKMKMFK